MKTIRSFKKLPNHLRKEFNNYLNKYHYISLNDFIFNDKWFNDYSLEEYIKQKTLKEQIKEAIKDDLK